MKDFKKITKSLTDIKEKVEHGKEVVGKEWENVEESLSELKKEFEKKERNKKES